MSDPKRCKDCGTVSNRFRLLTACAESHTNQYVCCYKDVCADYCTYVCKKCRQPYYINPRDGVENWYEKTRCPHCDYVNDTQATFHGNLREACHHLCGCGLESLDPIVVIGKSICPMLPEPMSPMQELWYTELLKGTKTVEGRASPKGKYDMWIGNKIWIRGQSIYSVTEASVFLVKRVTHYTDLYTYLTMEGWEKVAPHTGSYKAALTAYLAIQQPDGTQVFSPERVQQRGGINAVELQRL